MPGKPGRYAIIEQFLADGIHYMFGNPGTVEQGFLYALEEYPDFHYILCLQETIAVAMADGYARVTKKPAVVQLHSGVGLGNGIGMIYQAKRGEAPLVIIASEAGLRYDAMDAQMAADLVAMAEPVTKWATRVVDPGSLLRVLRRAVKIASTPPMGPVFVCLPADVLDAINDEPIVPTSIPATNTMPVAEDIERAADLLVGAQRPMIIMGDGVSYSFAQDELARMAEVLGAEVWGANSSEVNLSFKHPLFKGMLGHMFGASSSKITTQADAVLIVGTYVFPEVYPNLQGVFAPGAKIVHVDLNAYEIAKNFPVDLGLVANPKPTLALLADAVERKQTDVDKQAARQRLEASARANQEALEKQLAADAEARDSVPLRASRFMEELAKHVPEDVIVFDEALTVSPDVTRYLPPTLPDHFFQTRGGSLGVGIPGALGIKLARPDKTVIGFTGDGGSMYTIQALWTAARYNIPAKFVICNNQSYMLLKLNIIQYWRDQINEPMRDFPQSFDLDRPVVDFATLSRSMGVPALCVDHPDQVEDAVRQMMAHDGPFLIDMVISNAVPGV
ncbi:MAG: thiamine pyrophosphate-binding protein [Chloroflexota bacterium]|nr:MAG: thiamine pyrophosphate-binding protein [Chloroflexota bacterium]